MNDDQRHDIEFRTDCPGDSQSQGYDYGWTGAVGPRRLRIAEECRDPSANSCLRVHVPAQRQVVDAFMAAARASEFEALVAVLDPDVLPAGRPCRNMTPQAMGELVDELEELSYLERRPDPTDRRAKLIVLTDRGNARIAAGIATIEGIEERIEATLGACGHAQLRKLLTKLLEQA